MRGWTCCRRFSKFETNQSRIGILCNRNGSCKGDAGKVPGKFLLIPKDSRCMASGCQFSQVTNLLENSLLFERDKSNPKLL